MGRVSAIRRITAVLAIISVFAGTQGFVVSSHTCNSCGTHEELISLFGSQAGGNHECQAEEEKSCCQVPSLPAETNDSCCSDDAAACGEISGEACCEFETDVVTIETPREERASRSITNIQAVVLVAVAPVLYSPESSSRYIQPENTSGGGRDITKLTCCLLI
ncbi:MAG: hypothetical protein IH591_10695 [Bacteroidales bacterium]|nr:hypothetical protein [Bacteroidales bacterium]